MKITPKQYAQSLYELAADKPEAEVLVVLKTFVEMLIKNLDYGKIDEILANFARIYDEAHGELAVNLSSARTLSAESESDIANYLKNKTGFSKINFSTKIDTALIGGMVVRYGDKILDASLKNNLNNLKDKISQ
ncbi:MAG: ATP synthase F1 subunit delta [Candidatus Falkowbacteria bacterium]